MNSPTPRKARIAFANHREIGTVGVRRQCRQGSSPGSLGVFAVGVVDLARQCAGGVLALRFAAKALHALRLVG